MCNVHPESFTILFDVKQKADAKRSFFVNDTGQLTGNKLWGL